MAGGTGVHETWRDCRRFFVITKKRTKKTNQKIIILMIIFVGSVFVTLCFLNEQSPGGHFYCLCAWKKTQRIFSLLYTNLDVVGDPESVHTWSATQMHIWRRRRRSLGERKKKSLMRCRNDDRVIVFSSHGSRLTGVTAF